MPKIGSNISFKGTTKIYAISDTHQESRRTAAFLSKILQNKEGKNNEIFLHCGDYFGGIYPSDIERDCYIKLKEAKPDLEIVMTVGNHDVGYDKKGYEFFGDTIKKFKENGIRLVCANLIDISGKKADEISPYTIVERDGDKTFITGFCTRFLNRQGNKYIKAIAQSGKIDELVKSIKKENPDNIVILNHDFMEFSQEISENLAEKGINVDLIIGGHDHRRVEYDKTKNIYYPNVFAKQMYIFDIVNNGKSKKLENIKSVMNIDNKPKLDKIFCKQIEDYEKKEELFIPIAKSVLNLLRDYSGPSSFGSFFADSIKNAANADIGLVSTGFIKGSLKYIKGRNINKYNIMQVMPTITPVQIVKLNAKDLKEIFSHALKARGDKYSGGNPRFLQASTNIKIKGVKNYDKKSFDIQQIYINEAPIFDESGNPVDENKIYKCALDSFIANGGQNFDIFLKKEKQPLYIDSQLSKINEVLKNAIVDAQYNYEEGLEYPKFKIIEK